MKKIGWVILDADGDLANPVINYTKKDALEVVDFCNNSRSHYHAPYAVAKVYLKDGK